MLVFASSGTEGASLQTWVLDPDTGLIESDEPVFADGVPAWTTEIQAWNPTGEFDAPAMPVEDVLYYTVFDESDEGIQDAIGLAHREDGAWVDDGIVVRSEGEGDHPRAMDPAVFTDGSGQPWLVFGSHAGGIYTAKLDAQTGKLAERPDDPWCDDASDERFTLLARSGDGNDENTIEAATVVAHDDWYYLLVNWGRCCAGVESTYEIRMGRSRNPGGPFLDAAGVSLADGGGTLLLGSEGSQIGPGHAGVTTIDGEDGPQSILSYHFYDGETGGTARLGLRELTWNDGWPVAGEVLPVTTTPVGGEPDDEPGDDPQPDIPPADPLPPADDGGAGSEPDEGLAVVDLPAEGGRFRLVARDGSLIVRQGRQRIGELPLDGVRELAVVGSPAADEIQLDLRDLDGLGLEQISVVGGAGDDVIRLKALDAAFAGAVELFGEAGDDELIAGRSRLPVWLAGGDGNDRLVGGRGDDSLLGGAGDDRLFGSRGDDNLFGDAGHDKLFGGRGDDSLIGGGGDDQLRGGRGNDDLFDEDTEAAAAELVGDHWSVLWSEAGGKGEVLLEHTGGELHRLPAEQPLATTGLFDRLGNAFRGELLAADRAATLPPTEPLTGEPRRQLIEATGEVSLSRDDQGRLFANNLPVLFAGLAGSLAWQQIDQPAASWQPLAAEQMNGVNALLARNTEDGSLVVVQFDEDWQRVSGHEAAAADDPARPEIEETLAAAFAVEFPAEPAE